MVSKLTKRIILVGAGVFLMVSVLGSCKLLVAHPPVYVIDSVCGMKVDKSEAYEWKYNGVKYYFDTYNCKEAFKMNPEKVIENKCVETK